MFLTNQQHHKPAVITTPQVRYVSASFVPRMNITCIQTLSLLTIQRITMKLSRKSTMEVSTICSLRKIAQAMLKPKALIQAYRNRHNNADTQLSEQSHNQTTSSNLPHN